MNPYDIAIRISQRFLAGYLHHSQMANFFDLLKLEQTARNQRKNAFDDSAKREKMDRYIVSTFEKMPQYTVANIHTVAVDIKEAAYQDIKPNEKHWLKKGIEALANYEKETIEILRNLKKEAEGVNNEKLTKCIEKYIEDASEELEDIEHFFNELQKHEFDYDKLKKEKGETNMPRHDYDRPRSDDYRRRLEKERERKMRELDMLEAEMDNDRYEPMSDRYDEEDRFMPYWLPFMEDDRREPIYDRRGVPGTGRYSRRGRR